ncbi:hypothetical protein M902_2641 [Bacteriovorax sp. BAL6_X]|uniref:hypothetical protein n=1 Tax=Bacteriovorax sp. BAL6_X TaxID=1201290 RepID=UPI0003866D90|nr:hypothetical protein [Bacteriovorax sp. BAL6_X]EPZ51477.1 hypothetical protein M902_2641 [Bacteriovorax sp. BAL6_X]
MKRILLTTVVSATLTNSAQAMPSLMYEDMPSTSVATAITVAPIGFAIQAVGSVTHATFLASLAVFNPSEAVQMTKESLGIYNREEIERAIERRDIDIIDSLRDMVREDLKAGGQIESLEQLSDEDVDQLINVALYIPNESEE